MALFSDERAQSIQIGAVLIFAILIIFLAIWQAFVVPNQNEEIEFEHNQEVQQEMAELRGVVNSMPDAASTRSSSVRLGVRYPSRAIFVNPGPASGSLRTTGTTDEDVSVTFENVQVDGAAGDYWNDPEERGTYNTGSLVYEPGYNLFTNAPETVYEHSFLYNDFGEREGQRNALGVTGQSLVDGDKITLVTLSGEFNDGRTGTTSLDFRPVSTQTRTVEVESDDEDPLTITLPTRQNNVGVWEDAFEDEENADVSEAGDGLVEVELAEGTYDLRLAKIGVGTGVQGTDPTYLTDEPNDVESVRAGETETLRVEVRDEFNKPLRGVEVTAEADDGTLESNEVPTGSDGQAAFQYTAPNSEGEDNIDFTIGEEIGDPDEPENLQITVDVTESGDGAQAAYTTQWDEEAIEEEPGTTCDDGTCTLDFSEAQSLEMTGFTSPIAQGATVEFALENRDVASLDPSTANTDSDGEVSTTFEPEDDGTTNVYISSGGSGDTIEVEVINFGEEPEEPGVFNVEATDIVPNAEQDQTFRFTLNGDLPDGEAVEINLSDPQGDGVDYENEDAVVLTDEASGDANLVVDEEEDAATLTYTAQGNSDDGGTTIEIEVRNLIVDDIENDFAVQFERTDSEDDLEETTFEVVRGSGDSGFERVFVEDIEDGEDITQDIEFEVGPSDLRGEERIAIDLSDAQAETGSPPKIQYDGIESVNIGAADIEIEDGGGTAYIVYTAPESGVDAGEPVEITVEIEEAETTGQPGTMAEFDVGFSRASADTEGTEFTLTSN